MDNFQLTSTEEIEQLLRNPIYQKLMRAVLVRLEDDLLLFGGSMQNLQDAAAREQQAFSVLARLRMLRELKDLLLDEQAMKRQFSQ